jgi:succinate dehydrogenase / fumarate reductase membrane anchor subunit
MWVGLRDVLLDYTKPPGLQRLLLATVGGGLLAIAVSLAWILVSVPR